WLPPRPVPAALPPPALPQTPWATPRPPCCPTA
ncbi:MAG: hypothetical protein AVDCRST_MAG71-629, partial [uncultured Lysobacter sp.]